jgi:DNA adenine methylase
MIEQNHPLIQKIREQPPPPVLPLEIVKPFLKWVGGKTQLLDDVMALFPSKMRCYHEPFVGGGSVLLAFLSYVRAGRITVTGPIKASDINANLITLYKNIQSKPDELIAEVNRLSAEFAKATGTTVNRTPKTLEEALSSPESYYFWTRIRFNALPVTERSKPSASAALLFMNKTCFRGVYREGPNGFNVPFGNYKNPTIIDEQHINMVSALIKNVIFTVQPFTAALNQQTTADDFVYLDPPYAPENATSFVSYTADGFNLDAHNSLFSLIKSINARFLMSNADVPLVRAAFPAPYNTKIVSARRAINSKSPEAKTNEVLITK